MIFEVRSIATRKSLRTLQDGQKQPKDDPWTPQGGSKMAPRRPNTAPRWLQDGSKTTSPYGTPPYPPPHDICPGGKYYGGETPSTLPPNWGKHPPPHNICTLPPIDPSQNIWPPTKHHAGEGGQSRGIAPPPSPHDIWGGAIGKIRGDDSPGG